MSMDRDQIIATNAVTDFLNAPHVIPQSFSNLSPSQARFALSQLTGDPEFRSAALQRGTQAAGARLFLIGKQNGVQHTFDSLDRAISGAGPRRELPDGISEDDFIE
jgi:hypothetical protein